MSILGNYRTNSQIDMRTEIRTTANFIIRVWSESLIILMLFLVSILFVSCHSINERVDKNIPLKAFTGQLDQRIPVLMKTYEIPGVTIALVQKGKMVWSQAYGYADLENGRKMTKDTYCRVESISKSVTAWGVLKLVQEGKVELDAPVNQYLKGWSFPQSVIPTDRITVRQLLSQTSGMPLGTIGVRYTPHENRPSLKESLKKDAIPFQETGKSFSYSNTGFNLLELLIEEFTGRDFSEYMQEEVLSPLNMYRSSFEWSETFNPPVPHGYDPKGNSIPVYVYSTEAAGGLFSTVEDIATFVIAGMTSFSNTGFDVLNAEFIEKLYTSETEGRLPGYYGFVFDAYGFGYFTENLPNGQKAVSNGGQGSGWMSHFHSVPNTGDGIVILTNSQRSWPFFAHILNDWAKWSGFGQVGMAKIVWMAKVVKAMASLIFILLLWYLIKLGKSIFRGNRKFVLPSKKLTLSSFSQLVLSLLLFSAVWWITSLDYFFFFSVFPIGATHLLNVMYLAAVTLLLFSMFPIVEIQAERKKTNGTIT